MLRIYGASDDLVAVEGVTHSDRGGFRVGVGDEEIGCYDQDVRLSLIADEGGAVVTMRYGRNGKGVWSAAIEPFNEEVPIPWRIDVCSLAQSLYSVVVTIDCPEGTPLAIERISQ